MKSLPPLLLLLLAVAIALRRLINPVLGGNIPSMTVLTTTVVSKTLLSSGSIAARNAVAGFLLTDFAIDGRFLKMFTILRPS